MYRRIKGKICFASVLLSAFALAACGGGGGGGVVVGNPTFSNRFAISALSEFIPPSEYENLAAAGQSLAASLVQSPSDGLVFASSDAGITTVEIDKTQRENLEAGIWDFTFTSTASSTVNMTVTLRPSQGPLDDPLDDSLDHPFNPGIIDIDGTDGFIGDVFLLAAVLPGSEDWLYAGAWLYAPNDSDDFDDFDVPDNVTMVFFAGSDFPSTATDLAALTGTARYGSRGSEDGYLPEAFGVYTGPDGTAPFVADALLEANFDTDMISGVIENIDSDNGRYSFKLNLQPTTIGGEEGGYFVGTTGTTEGAGGPIAGWTGEYGGKFHGTDMDPTVDYPAGVSGTFGAEHPDNNGQSISGFFLSGFNR